MKSKDLPCAFGEQLLTFKRKKKLHFPLTLKLYLDMAAYVSIDIYRSFGRNEEKKIRSLHTTSSYEYKFWKNYFNSEYIENHVLN